MHFFSFAWFSHTSVLSRILKLARDRLRGLPIKTDCSPPTQMAKMVGEYRNICAHSAHILEGEGEERWDARRRHRRMCGVCDGATAVHRREFTGGGRHHRGHHGWRGWHDQWRFAVDFSENFQIILSFIKIPENV